MVPRPGEKVCLVGQTGSGKSYAARRLAGAYYGRRQIIVADLKHDPMWNGLDAQIIRKASQLPRARFPRVPVVVWRPDGDAAHDMHLMDSLFAWVYRRGNTVLVVDEVSAMVGGPTSYGPGFGDLVTRGRVRECTCIMGTQRPVMVPRIVFSESVKFGVFYLVDKRDRDTVAAFSAAEVAAPVGDRHGLWWVDTRQRSATYLPSLPTA